MSVVVLGTDSMRVFKQLKHMYVTPYINEATVGFTTYDLRGIVSDSVEIAQDDNSVNTKDSEFFDAPLLENTSLGAFQFSSTCVDFQNPVLRDIFQFEESNSMLFSRAKHKPSWCIIELIFNGDVPSIVIPKLRMDTKIAIGSLKTGSAEGTIRGTAKEQSFTVWYNGNTIIGTSSLFFCPIGATFNVRSDYGYLLWTSGSRVLWDNGDVIIN